MKVLKELSREGLYNVLQNHVDFTGVALLGMSKADLEGLSKHLIDLDEIDEIEFIIELDGE